MTIKFYLFAFKQDKRFFNKNSIFYSRLVFIRIKILEHNQQNILVKNISCCYWISERSEQHPLNLNS